MTDFPEPAFPWIDIILFEPNFIESINSVLFISYSPFIYSSILASSISLLLSTARKNFFIFSFSGCTCISSNLSITLEKSEDISLWRTFSPGDIRDFVYTLYAIIISLINCSISSLSSYSIWVLFSKNFWTISSISFSEKIWSWYFSLISILNLSRHDCTTGLSEFQSFRLGPFFLTFSFISVIQLRPASSIVSIELIRPITATWSIL